MDWKRIYPKGSRRIQLPRYPWQRETYWVETSTSRMDRLGTDRHMLLGNRMDSPLPVWEATSTSTGCPTWTTTRSKAPSSSRRRDTWKPHWRHSARSIRKNQASSNPWNSIRRCWSATATSLACGSNWMPKVEGCNPQPRRRRREWKLHVTARLSQAMPTPPPVRSTCPQSGSDAATRRKSKRSTNNSAATACSTALTSSGIRRLCRGPDEVLAEVEAHPELEIDAGLDLLHPTLVDACFQALIAALSARTLPAGPHQPRLRIRQGASSFADPWPHHTPDQAVSSTATSRLTDEQGRLLAEIKGLRCQILATQPRTDETAARKMTYAYPGSGPKRLPTIRVTKKTRPLVDFRRQWGIGNKLTAIMRKGGADCLTICDGPEFKQIGPANSMCEQTAPKISSG